MLELEARFVTTLTKPLWPLAVALSSAVVVFSAHQAFVRLGEGDMSGASLRPGGIRAHRAEPPAAAVAGLDVEHRASSAAASSGGGVPNLLEASESFRNTSLLIAIRDAGYVCTDIVTAAAGTDDAAAWRVSCDGALAYLVSVDADGELGVVPLMYGDNLPLLVPDGANPLREPNERLRLEWLDRTQPIEPPPR